MKNSCRRPRVFMAGLVALAAAGGALWWLRSVQSTSNGEARPGGGAAPSVSSLSGLLALPVETLDRVDIARMNLLCAQGLPGAKDLDLDRSLGVLDEMAARVRAETDRHFYL